MNKLLTHFTKRIAQGFTLIELLIVIAIIGILTALITTNLQGARERARDSRRKSDLRAINQSLRLYYNDYKGFPTSSSPGYEIKGCSAAGAVCAWGGPFAIGTTYYMNSLPLDPSSTTASPKEYIYRSTTSDVMVIVAQLENLSDPDIAESQARCTTPYTAIPAAARDSTKDYVLCAQ